MFCAICFVQWLIEFDFFKIFSLCLYLSIEKINKIRGNQQPAVMDMWKGNCCWLFLIEHVQAHCNAKIMCHLTCCRWVNFHLNLKKFFCAMSCGSAQLIKIADSTYLEKYFHVLITRRISLFFIQLEDSFIAFSELLTKMMSGLMNWVNWKFSLCSRRK